MPDDDGRPCCGSYFNGHIFAISPRDAPEVCQKKSRLLDEEGTGNAGRPMRPQPCVQKMKPRKQVTTVTPETPGIPRAMVLTVSSGLSSGTGLCCPRRPRNRFHRLDASVGASGPYDFAVRVSAVRQKRCLRPSHPLPYVRDDRETPLCAGGNGHGYAGDLGQTGIGIFLRKGLDRWNRIDPVP